MSLDNIEKSINEAFANKDKIDSSDKSLNDLVRETLRLQMKASKQHFLQ